MKRLCECFFVTYNVYQYCALRSCATVSGNENVEIYIKSL